MTTPTNPPKLIENAHAPEIFADGAPGFFLLNGVVHIALERAKYLQDPPQGQTVRVVVGRICMPVGGAQALALGLMEFLRLQGLEPVPPRPASSLN